MPSLAELTVATADMRRKHQKTLSRWMPADAAAAATVLSVPRGNDSTYSTPRPPETHESGVQALRHIHVVTALAEPNVLNTGRSAIWTGVERPNAERLTDDGVIDAAWTSPTAHDAATAGVMEFYERFYPGFDDLADNVRGFGLDSWRSPLLLAPVRHRYLDGSPTRLRWMALEGTARLLVARRAIAAQTADWLADHPFTDPTAAWPGDVVTWRTFLAAARRATETAGGGDAYRTWVHGITDWADLVVPDGGLIDGAAWPTAISRWAFLTHSGNDGGVSDGDDDLDDEEDDVTTEQFAALINRMAGLSRGEGSAAPNP